MPFGLLALADARAARTSSSPMPYLNSACGLQLDPHRGQRGAADQHLPDPAQLRQLLLQHCAGRVVDLAAVSVSRGQRDDQDRRVRRVHLAVGRVGQQVGRQVGPRGVDRRLHVARGAVDVAVEAELHGDARLPDLALRRHLGHVGDLAQMAFQRARQAGRHGLRIWRRATGPARRWSGNRPRAGMPRAAGRRRWRRRARMAMRQQRGGDRPLDERGGDVHSAGAVAPSPASAVGAAPSQPHRQPVETADRSPGW